MLLPLLLVLSGQTAQAGWWGFVSFPEVKGQVLDNDSKEPIPGATVKVTYRAVRPHLFDSAFRYLKSIEVKSDEHGRFHLPPFSKWAGFKTYEDVIWFRPTKPGYVNHLAVVSLKDGKATIDSHRPTLVRKPFVTWDSESHDFVVGIEKRAQHLAGNTVHKLMNTKRYLWAACIDPENPYGYPPKYLWSRYDKTTGHWESRSEPPPGVGEDYQVSEPSPEGSAFVDGTYRWFVDRYKSMDNRYSLIQEDMKTGEIVKRYLLQFPVVQNYPCVKVDGSSKYIFAGFIDSHLGIVRLDRKTGDLKYYAGDGNSGLSSHGITDLVIDGEFLWIATPLWGVQRLHIPTGQWTYFMY